MFRTADFSQSARLTLDAHETITVSAGKAWEHLVDCWCGRGSARIVGWKDIMKLLDKPTNIR